MLLFILTVAVCLAAFILDINDRSTDVYPNDDTIIRLYGEAHGSHEYYDIELVLWKSCYEKGYRNLFLDYSEIGIKLIFCFITDHYAAL